MSAIDKVSMILGILSFSSCLFYWTGRWYKQCYFQNFHIPYESVEFNHYYYIFHSWCTVFVALCSLIIIFNIIAAIASFFYPQGLKSLKIIWLLISIIAASGFLRDKFNPFRFLLKKIKGSRDILIIFLTPVPCLFAFFSKGGFFKIADINSLIGGYGIPIIIITSVIILWSWFAIVGYILGKFHAESAIKHGKMGIQHVKLKSKPKRQNEFAANNLYFIVRASENRNFIYNKDNETAFCVTDSEIEMFFSPKHKDKKDEKI